MKRDRTEASVVHYSKYSIASRLAGCENSGDIRGRARRLASGHCATANFFEAGTISTPWSLATLAKRETPLKPFRKRHEEPILRKMQLIIAGSTLMEKNPLQIRLAGRQQSQMAYAAGMKHIV
jgi:hypothetical protein